MFKEVVVVVVVWKWWWWYEDPKLGPRNSTAILDRGNYSRGRPE